MDFINNFNKFNNIDDITYSIRNNNKGKNIKIKNIINIVYSSNNNYIYKLCKKADNIINNTKYRDLHELVYLSNNLINQLESIPTGNDIKMKIILFDDIFDQFDSMYKKFFDTKYKKMYILINDIVKLIQISSINKKNITNELRSMFDKIFKVDKYITIQFMIRNLNHFYNIDKNMKSVILEYINKTYKESKSFVLLILISEIKKITISKSNDLYLKRYLYYNISLRLIKSEFQFDKPDKFEFYKSVNIIKRLYNMKNTSNIDIDEMFNNLKDIIIIITTNDKIVEEIFNENKYLFNNKE